MQQLSDYQYSTWNTILQHFNYHSHFLWLHNYTLILYSKCLSDKWSQAAWTGAKLKCSRMYQVWPYMMVGLAQRNCNEDTWIHFLSTHQPCYFTSLCPIPFLHFICLHCILSGQDIGFYFTFLHSRYKKEASVKTVPRLLTIEIRRNVTAQFSILCSPNILQSKPWEVIKT